MSADKDSLLLARVDERVCSIDEKLDRLMDKVESHGGRLRSLEQWRSGVKGALSVLSGVVAAIVTFGSLLVAKLMGL